MCLPLDGRLGCEFGDLIRYLVGIEEEPDC